MAGRADIKAGGAYVELTLRNNAFLKGLRGALSHLTSFAKGFAIAGAAGIGAAAAIGGVALRAFMSTGDELDKMRQRTGFSVETLSELRHAADQSGSSMEDLENGIRKMQKQLGQAGPVSKELEGALSELGLNASQLQAMSPEQQFDAMYETIVVIPVLPRTTYNPSNTDIVTLQEVAVDTNVKVDSPGNPTKLQQTKRTIKSFPKPDDSADSDVIGIETC